MPMGRSGVSGVNAVIQIAIITMQNFFTPVEVVRKHPLCYSNEELLRFNETLFQITQPRVPSLADQRKKVIHWLRSLPLAQRQQAAAIHSTQWSALLRRLYQESETLAQPLRYRFQLQDGEYRVVRERFYKQMREEERSSMGVALLVDVRLVSQGQLFEAITLVQSAMSDPDALFERLETILGGVLLDGNSFSEQQLKSGKVCFQAETTDSEFKTLGVWVAELLIKQILLSFTAAPPRIEQTIKHNKQQEQEYSRLWRQLPPADRLRLVQRGFSKPFQELMEDYRHSVAVVVWELPKLYTSYPIQEAIREYTDINGKQLFLRLTLSTLEQSLNLYQIFKIQLIMEIEAHLAGAKNGAPKKKKHKKKNNAERIDSVPVTTAPIIPKKNKIEKQSIETPQTPSKIEAIQTTTLQQNDQKQTQQEVTSIQDHEQTSKMPKIPIPAVKNDQSILDDFVRRIKQRNRDKYRKIILNRLTVILSQLSLACRPFGSYAVHLSLPDSDLDIQVDSSLLGYFYLDYLTQHKQVVAALEFLKKFLEPQPWVSGFQLFYNARIPLLTFKADAGVHFANPTNIKSKLRLNGKAIPNGEAAIQVDLSIQPYANMTELPHNGLQATGLIGEWIDSMANLQRVVLGLKAIIRKANLHKSYQGGLSSYCLVLLAVAFLKLNNPGERSSDALFEDLIRFIKRFHEERLVIDVSSQQIIQKRQGETIPTLISPWDGRNLVERAFRLEEALGALEKWKQNLHL